METKQSAVQWLVNEILVSWDEYMNDDFEFDFTKPPKKTYYNAFIDSTELSEFVNKALEMEKEQILDACHHGVDYDKSPYKNAEEYYNKTYGEAN